MPRSKAYDRDAVLQKAMLFFWKKGYEATGIEDLEKRMGINRFSIYSTFQSKQQLFRAALDRYDGRCGDKVRASLTAAEAGLPTLKLFFRSLTTQAEQGTGWDVLCATPRLSVLWLILKSRHVSKAILSDSKRHFTPFFKTPAKGEGENEN